jgi:hypothetical protein
MVPFSHLPSICSVIVICVGFFIELIIKLLPDCRVLVMGLQTLMILTQRIAVD